MPKSQPLGKQPRQHIDAYGGIKAGTSRSGSAPDTLGRAE